MKLTDTISVNPGKSALGHVEKSSSSLLRSSVLDRQVNPKIDFLSLTFPSLGSGATEYKKYALPLRVLFATILIVTGLSMFSSSVGLHASGLAISTITFGGMLALGLLTRPVMIGAAIFYCISGALGVRAGAMDITLFSLMFGCVMFGILGAGRYSCDILLRGAIQRHRKNVEIKKKNDMMGYKAFHNMM